MNKLDLIIEALEVASHVPKGVVYPAGYPMQIAQALAAARELWDMKPVAWGVLRANNVELKLLSLTRGAEIDLKWIPLYTLGESA